MFLMAAKRQMILKLPAKNTKNTTALIISAIVALLGKGMLNLFGNQIVNTCCYLGIDVLSNINKLVFNKNACAYYRHRSNSTITSKFSKRKLDELLALEHINEVYLRLGYTELFDQNMSLYLSKAMNLCVKIKNSDLTL